MNFFMTTKTFPRVLIYALAAVAAVTVHASALPNRSAEFVNDFAGVVSPEARDAINSKAADVRDKYNGAQIVVVTVPALDGMSIEEYAHKLFNTWKLGDKNLNNGVLLLIVPNAPKGSRLRIEVGYGLEGNITDGTAGHILDQILPLYEKGNYSAAAVKGFELIAKRVAEGDHAKESDSSDLDNLNIEEIISVYIFGLFVSFILLAVFFGIIISVFDIKNISYDKIKSMEIKKGGFAEDGTDIEKRTNKATSRFYLRGKITSLAISAVVPIILYFVPLPVPKTVTNVIVMWLIGVSFWPIITLIGYRKRIHAYACLKCGKIMDYAYVVEKNPTYEAEGKAKWYFACPSCRSKYAEPVVLPKRYKPSGSDGSSDRDWSSSSSDRDWGGGGSSGGGGASR